MKTIFLCATLAFMPVTVFGQISRTVPDSTAARQPGSLLIARIPPGYHTNMPVYKPDSTVHYHLLIAGTGRDRGVDLRNIIPPERLKIVPPDMKKILPPDSQKILPPAPRKLLLHKRLHENGDGKK